LTTYLLPVVACLANRTSPWVPSPMRRPKMSCDADVKGTPRAALAGRDLGLDLRRRAEAPVAVALDGFEPPMRALEARRGSEIEPRNARALTFNLIAKTRRQVARISGDVVLAGALREARLGR